MTKDFPEYLRKGYVNMLSCKVSVINKNCEQCTKVVHAHSRADLYHEIAELCAAFDAESGYQISGIKVDSIKSEDD